MKILGLDYGTKRIGVALSDGLLITAQGMDSIYRNDLASDLNAIKKIIDDNGVVELVVGLPLNMDGTHSAKTKEAVQFMDSLAKTVAIPVKPWDERLTTVQAEHALLEADISRAKRRHLTDKLAAQMILQSYLDSRKKGQ